MAENIDIAIEVKNLTKRYRGGVTAVDDVSFAVKRQEIFGFLGPNGAGKTTTIKILTTLLKKTSGRAFVNGYDVAKQPTAIRKAIGYTSQDIEIEEDLTGRENLVLAGRLYHLSGKKIRQRVDELLQILGLEDAADRLAGTYSGGMRKRIDLATVLIHEPKILFLDEPTTGLDPQSRHALWGYVERLHNQGVTIFLTTQYMEEVDRLCHRLAIIDFGKIVAEGNPKELKEEIGADTLTLKIDGDQVRAREHMALAEKLLQPVSYIAATKQLADNRLLVYIRNGTEAIAEVIRLLDKEDISLGPVSFAQSSLDDVFMKYTGRELRVEEGKKKTRFPRARRRRY